MIYREQKLDIYNFKTLENYTENCQKYFYHVFLSLKLDNIVTSFYVCEWSEAVAQGL